MVVLGQAWVSFVPNRAGGEKKELAQTAFQSRVSSLHVAARLAWRPKEGSGAGIAGGQLDDNSQQRVYTVHSACSAVFWNDAPAVGAHVKRAAGA
jgi:hypothetical protein